MAASARCAGRRRGVRDGRRPPHQPPRRGAPGEPGRRRGAPGVGDGHELRRPGALGGVPRAATAPRARVYPVPRRIDHEIAALKLARWAWRSTSSPRSSAATWPRGTWAVPDRGPSQRRPGPRRSSGSRTTRSRCSTRRACPARRSRWAAARGPRWWTPSAASRSAAPPPSGSPARWAWRWPRPAGRPGASGCARGRGPPPRGCGVAADGRQPGVGGRRGGALAAAHPRGAGGAGR